MNKRPSPSAISLCAFIIPYAKLSYTKLSHQIAVPESKRQSLLFTTFSLATPEPVRICKGFDLHLYYLFCFLHFPKDATLILIFGA